MSRTDLTSQTYLCFYMYKWCTSHQTGSGCRTCVHCTRDSEIQYKLAYWISNHKDKSMIYDWKFHWPKTGKYIHTNSKFIVIKFTLIGQNRNSLIIHVLVHKETKIPTAATILFHFHYYINHSPKHFHGKIDLRNLTVGFYPYIPTCTSDLFHGTNWN